MNQTRRSFLTRLASGIVGVSLVDVEWIPTPILRQFRELPAPTDIEGITAWVVRLMAEELRGYRAEFVPGDYRHADLGFVDQWNIATTLPDEHIQDGVPVDAYLRPIACRLAHEVSYRHVSHFGGLPIPLGYIEGVLAKDDMTGIAVRGVRLYDVVGAGYEDEYEHWVETRPPGWQLRFDILTKSI